jgi:hypothetical protein
LSPTCYPGSGAPLGYGHAYGNVSANRSDLAAWRRAASELGVIENKHELLAAFADIEDRFENLETQVDDLIERIDIESGREEEMRRGK